jgi:hypothetical protein
MNVTVIWDVLQRSLVALCRHLRGKCCLHLQSKEQIHPDNDGKTFLRNAGSDQSDHMALRINREVGRSTFL